MVGAPSPARQRDASRDPSTFLLSVHGNYYFGIAELASYDPSLLFLDGSLPSSPSASYGVRVRSTRTNADFDTFIAARQSASGVCYSVKSVLGSGAGTGLFYGWSAGGTPCSADAMTTATTTDGWPS